MSILNSLLLKTSSIKNISILFIASHLVLLVMMIYTFPVINNQIGTEAFDLQTFGYSVSVAESIVYSLDDRTTDLYIFPQLTLLDLFYPFLLALFLSSLLFRLFSITESKSKTTAMLLTIPFLAMLFDYAENVCIILMVSKSMEPGEAIVFLSSTCTVLKGIITSLAWIAVLVYSVKWFRGRGTGKNQLVASKKRLKGRKRFSFNHSVPRQKSLIIFETKDSAQADFKHS